MLIQRKNQKNIIAAIKPGKVVIILGARRVGKTILLQEISKHLEEPYLNLNGEDLGTQELLARRSLAHYKSVLGKHRILLIDEAQAIPEIGKILKLLVDGIKQLRVIVSGSSAFDLSSSLGEPLTGRKNTFYLFPFSEEELMAIEKPQERKDRLHQRLVYGNYPELSQIGDLQQKRDYLMEIVSSYLLKDILAFENIRSADKIKRLLQLIAFQIGKEVSMDELGKQLAMSKNTVDRYLDLLSKVFVLYKVPGFSRNLRKEISKSSRWYFYDNGLRNALIANFNPISLRNDMGDLWENYAITERIKFQHYHKIISNNYFWRTYDQQELDWVEEREGKLFAYEMKWNTRKVAKAPSAWAKGYPGSDFEVINPENFHKIVTGNVGF